jgi:hypothetical protein
MCRLLTLLQLLRYETLLDGAPGASLSYPHSSFLENLASAECEDSLAAAILP